MTDLNLDRLEELEKAATPGPWEDYSHDLTDEVLVKHDSEVWIDVAWIGDGHEPQAGKDAEFIAQMRNATPALISRVRELEATVEKVRGVLAGWEKRQERNREILGSGGLGHFQSIDCIGDLRTALEAIGGDDE